MKQIYTLIALGAFALAGCSTDELTPLTPEGGGEASNSPVTIVASLNAPSTRTGHDETDANDLAQPINVTWAAGDGIVIYSLGAMPGELKGKATFTLVADDAGKYSGKFTGAAAPVTGDSYCIYSPSTVVREDGDHWLQGFSLTGQKQTGNNSLAHLSAKDVMCGCMVKEGDYTQISFAANDEYGTGHLAALMTFDLSDIPADLGEPQRIVLGTSKAGAPTKGHFYDDISGKNGGLTYPAVNTLTLDLENVNVANGGKIKAYMMMVPTTIPAGDNLTITLVGSNKSYMFTSPAIGAAGKEYKAGWRYVAKVSGIGSWKEAAKASIVYDGNTTASATFGGGDGTGEHGSATNPYLISTAGELQKLINDVNRGSDYSDTYFKLTQDINITAPKWTPIGEDMTMFAGAFDGGGHTLSGTMTDGTNQSYYGFFGNINSATITNLHSTAQVVAGNNAKNVGSIVGYAQGGSVISNCTTKSGATVSGYVFTGGVVGTIAGNSNIIGCSNAATVTNDNIDSFETGVGGIVGKQIGGNISGCFNIGGITNQYSSPKGAIAGVSGTLSYCRYLSANGIKATGLYEDTKYTDVSSSTDFATLNGTAAIAALNIGITIWNNVDPTAKPVLSFFKGATLPVPAPPTTGGGGIGGIGDSGSAW